MHTRSMRGDAEPFRGRVGTAGARGAPARGARTSAAARRRYRAVRDRYGTPLPPGGRTHPPRAREGQGGAHPLRPERSEPPRRAPLPGCRLRRPAAAQQRLSRRPQCAVRHPARLAALPQPRRGRIARRCGRAPVVRRGRPAPRGTFGASEQREHGAARRGRTGRRGGGGHRARLSGGPTPGPGAGRRPQCAGRPPSGLGLSGRRKRRH